MENESSNEKSIKPLKKIKPPEYLFVRALNKHLIPSYIRNIKAKGRKNEK